MVLVDPAATLGGDLRKPNFVRFFFGDKAISTVAWVEATSLQRSLGSLLKDAGDLTTLAEVGFPFSTVSKVS